ncbi:hypothetical protein RhiLY_02896 [Ceratobasidium sp. AG-Ba]|nr:hypothetical protein RhiLY_02896 [Ceratobasidium sp. AG-Ba]
MGGADASWDRQCASRLAEILQNCVTAAWQSWPVPAASPLMPADPGTRALSQLTRAPAHHHRRLARSQRLTLDHTQRLPPLSPPPPPSVYPPPSSMAQPGSQNTTPSPVIPSALTASADLAGIDADEHAQRQKAIDTFLARTEFSKLARVLPREPSRAPSGSLGPFSEAQAQPHQYDAPARHNDGSRLWRSAGMSLYQAVLAPNEPGSSHGPGPAPNGVNHPRRSRAHGPINAHPSTQPNGRERLLAPGRTVRNAPRRRHAHTLSTEREDINAATTLTAIMRGGGTPTNTLSRASSASSVGALPVSEAPASGGGRTPQPDDAQAAELMLFLATSPSPARPSTTRPRQPTSQPPSSGMSGLGLVDSHGPARVLFPSAPNPDRVQQLPTPSGSQDAMNTPPPIDGSRGGSFNLGDYINVSPSPAGAGIGSGGSALPAGMAVQGRRLFDESDGTLGPYDRHSNVNY